MSVAETGVTSPPQVSPQPQAVNNRQSDKGLPPRNPRGSGGSNYNRDRDANRGDRERDRDSRDRNEREPRQPERDRDRREPRERLSSRSSNALNADTGSTDGDRSRPVNTYSDAHQLFVGNLPHTVTVPEIRV